MIELLTLAKSGVYLFSGFEIPNYAEHNLNEEKVYQVLKDEYFVLSIGFQARSGKIPVYLSSPLNGDPVGELSEVVIYEGEVTSNMIVKDRKTIDEMLDNDLRYYSCGYLTNLKLESGFYNGVHYDLSFCDPKLENVSIVEKVKEPIKKLGA